MKDEIIIVLLVIITLILIHRRVSFATPGTLTSPAPVIGGPDVNNPFKVGIKTNAQKTAFTNLFNDIASYLTTNCLYIGSTPRTSYGISITTRRNCPITTYASTTGPVIVKTITQTHVDAIKQKLSTFIQTNAALFGFGDANTNNNNPYRDQWNTLNNAVLSRIMPTPIDLRAILTGSISGTTLKLGMCDTIVPSSVPLVMAQNIVWSVSNYI